MTPLGYMKMFRLLYFKLLFTTARTYKTIIIKNNVNHAF